MATLRVYGCGLAHTAKPPLPRERVPGLVRRLRETGMESRDTSSARVPILGRQRPPCVSACRFNYPSLGLVDWSGAVIRECHSATKQLVPSYQKRQQEIVYIVTC